MDTWVYAGFIAVLAAAIVAHLRTHQRKEAAAVAAAARIGQVSTGPRAQHPHIDLDWCIGCGACVTACPEGDVLRVLAGKAALVNGHKCIGHGLCAEACPVGAIEIVMAPPSMTADLPALTPEFETSVPNLFIAGELGGLALIKNAINQGRDSIDHIAKRASSWQGLAGDGEVTVDTAIIGAGPAGLSAALRAKQLGLSHVVLEAEEFGGTVSHYPRQKLVMTSPVEFPTYGKFTKLEISKEELLEVWSSAMRKVDLAIHTQERVESITRNESKVFLVKTAKGEYRAHSVVLAIGRRGSPRKLGIPGEELPHVMYSLLDAEAYSGKRILVVGGGDSAVEAAMGLAHQPGNQVVMSYRRSEFSRLKDRNEKRLAEMVADGSLKVLYRSQPVEIRAQSVTLAMGEEQKEIPADFVWVFAGGTPPKAFLESIGIAFGRQDLQTAIRAECPTAVTNR